MVGHARIADRAQENRIEWAELLDTVLRHHDREDILPDINENLVVELYSK